MSDVIQLLPDHIANQIAAGEVIQRPASVVKELLENAIDARASEIKLVIKDAGKTLIQVTDNGVGMSVTDARLAFERHATSKIRSAEDLFDLHTKGFRGEALASIAAIARVEMTTKRAVDELGTEIRNEGNKITYQEPCVVNDGTTFAVKSLFFNIPARRNFLKSDTVELRHILDEFHRVALAHPEVHFYLYNNGSELFNLPASNFRQRIVGIFGKKIDAGLVPVEEETEALKISGYILKPEFLRKTKQQQFFIVNRRYIKSRYLHHAIAQAYEGLIKEGMQPEYFLNLEVCPKTIDINIHPTKTEVKFENEQVLYSLLKSAIKHSLGQFNVMPSLDFSRDPSLDLPYEYKNKTPEFPKVKVDPTFNPFEQEKKSSGYSNSHFSTPKKSWESLYTGTSSQEVARVMQWEEEENQKELFEDSGEQMVSPTMIFGGKYLLKLGNNELLAIHIRRAHQRVLYERYLKNIERTNIASQQLLFPLSIELSSLELSIVSELEETLSTIGFLFHLEEDKIVISGVPLNVSESQVEDILEELLHQYKEGIPEDTFTQNELFARSMSKSLAVKSGFGMSVEQQQQLLKDLFMCDDSLFSPFNKKIYSPITLNDIDKKLQ